MEFDMKKKLILATAIVLLLAISVTMFVGCDEIIKKNEERDATQIVATVNYREKTDYVYKYELQSVFNSYAYAYVNYYGMTYEEVANTLVKSLAQQKLLNMFALYTVADIQEVNVPSKAEELLSKSEINKAISDSNDSMLSTLVSIVEDLVTEDNANAGGNNIGKSDDTKVEVTKENETYVRFDTNGATAIEKQIIAKGTKATEPDAPTKTGYTFYGWYLTKDFSGEEFDFDTAVNNDIVLYAKWVKHTDARTQRPEAEKEDDYDPDNNDIKDEDMAKKFFSEDYQKEMLKEDGDIFTEKFLKADFAKNIVFDENETTLVAVLKEYIGEGLADMKKQLMSNLHKKSVEDCYEYYLNSQMQSLLITRLKRLVEDQVTVDPAEIQKQFDDAVAKNIESYKDNESGYQSSLTSSLSGTYYHPTKDYGFVINILLKLNDDDMKTLTDFTKEHPGHGAEAMILRNQLIANMNVKVSNPNYKADSKIEDKDGNEIEVRDADTDSRNPYNKVGKTESNPYDNSYEYETGEGTYANDYNQIISFEQVDGKYQVVFKATQHPSMAYLIEEVPAFDKDGKTGIVHQIQNSFAQVKAANLEYAQEVYWLREVATAWAYIVGDDSGAITSSSNNNGLGYLITPEGQDSTYLSDFTDYARELIKKGTGSFCANETTDFSASFAGDKNAYVIADNVITEKDGQYSINNPSSPYAGVFVLLNSYTVWDASNLTDGATLDEVTKTLPLDYIITFAKDADDVKTIRQTIEDTLKAAKSTDKYNSLVNNMLNSEKDKIKYEDKIIKEVWKDAE